jgi:hypothetical protein
MIEYILLFYDERGIYFKVANYNRLASGDVKDIAALLAHTALAICVNLTTLTWKRRSGRNTNRTMHAEPIPKSNGYIGTYGVIDRSHT